jgi:hypothetical protein
MTDQELEARVRAGHERNARWNATLDALLAISLDPKETGSRRRLARDAWERAVFDGGHGCATEAMEPLTPLRGNHRGGFALAADAAYDGWDRL